MANCPVCTGSRLPDDVSLVGKTGKRVSTGSRLPDDVSLVGKTGKRVRTVPKNLDCRL